MADLSVWKTLANAHRVACGQRLADVRTSAGLTVEQVAERNGVPPHVVSEWEEGLLPSVARMYAVADSLGVGPGDIWGFHE
jgi:transcriptional regulator with XRE-family HTH domain